MTAIQHHATLTQLWIYPVKSLGGIKLEKSLLTAEGLAFDRRWMIVDETGLFITQRKIPNMGLIEVALGEQGQLELSYHSHPSIRISPDDCQHPAQVRVWHSDCEALVAPAAINHWINTVLQSQNLRLVYLKPNFKRPLDAARFGAHYTGFADGAPLLIANQASLNALNSQLETPLPMARFRPNIVLDGIPAFSEHSLTQLKLGDVTLNLVDHCQRCSMITLQEQLIDGQRQLKSTHAAEIFKTLAQLNPMPNNAKAPAFGVNSTIALGNGQMLSVGMQGLLLA